MNALTLTVTATAELMGFNRAVVSRLCQRGELQYVPAIRPDGSRSRIHKKVVRASVDAWISKNTIKSPSDLKRAVDGRRK